MQGEQNLDSVAASRRLNWLEVLVIMAAFAAGSQLLSWLDGGASWWPKESSSFVTGAFFFAALIAGAYGWRHRKTPGGAASIPPFLLSTWLEVIILLASIAAYSQLTSWIDGLGFWWSAVGAFYVMGAFVVARLGAVAFGWAAMQRVVGLISTLALPAFALLAQHALRIPFGAFNGWPESADLLSRGVVSMAAGGAAIALATAAVLRARNTPARLASFSFALALMVVAAWPWVADLPSVGERLVLLIGFVAVGVAAASIAPTQRRALELGSR